MGATLILLTLGSGCAANASSTDKQIQSLRDELTMTQTALDRMEERLSAMEASSKVSAAAPPAGGGTGLLARPDLRVVKLTPANPGTGAESAPDPASPPTVAQAPEEAEGERPVIVGEGSRLETRMQRPGAEVMPSTPASKRK